MKRRDQIFAANVDRLHRETDRMFGKLLLAQWAFAIVLALLISPWSYDGTERHLHVHVVAAIVFGGVINSLPLLLIRLRPGWWGTRHTVAGVQMLWSALLIMITGGRIETHFHVFGSLAFLAMYRDWRVLPTATLVVAADHLSRGLWWPDSVYGVGNPEWWRFLEHAAWVAFEDVVLVFACLRGIRDMRDAANREARLERTNAMVEREVKERTEELRTSMLQLQQAQKLEAVGRLAAGVAHEINTPVQFVSDSVEFVRASVADLIGVVGKQQAAHAEIDLAYLAEEMPRALDRATDGLDRVAKIVRSMKIFAHTRGEASEVDLDTAVDSTLTIARNEYRYVADLETSFGGLPKVWCHGGEINQVVLNIIVNAAHAIADVHATTGTRGKLGVRTSIDGDWAVISISDTGPGIPDAIRERMFDPFFTTKPVGRGTGQGLAIARTIVEKHHGTLRCETTLGRGSTFQIRIPVRQQEEARAA